MRDLIDRTPSLQYKIELLLAGMVDGPSSSLGKGEKLELLRRHQHAHHTLSADVLSKTRDVPEQREYVYSTNGLLIEYVEPSLVAISSPPSIMRGIPGMSWEFRADFELENVIVDIAQDLLVAVSRNDG